MMQGVAYLAKLKHQNKYLIIRGPFNMKNELFYKNLSSGDKSLLSFIFVFSYWM